MAPSPHWIIDGHLDLSLNYRRYGRDITLPLSALRSAPGEPHPRGGTATVSLPTLREGQVGIAFATTLALPRSPDSTEPLGPCESRTPREASATSQRDIECYRQLQSAGRLRMLTQARELDEHVARWQTASPARDLGVVLMMEGAEPIESPDDLAEWWERGLRILAPSWYGVNRYAHGTGAPGGLTEPGRELIRKMNQTSLILDTSHLAEESFFEALELFEGTVIASHSNVQAIAPGDRQLSDAMIRHLAQRGGVIGVVMNLWMLVAGWEKDQSNAGLTLEKVADHVDHICQVTGDVRHVAIGSDLDGGFGKEQCPEDLDTIADLQKLLAVLEGRGYDGEALEAISHGNWLTVLRKAWT